jgi:hypothetical protein
MLFALRVYFSVCISLIRSAVSFTFHSMLFIGPVVYASTCYLHHVLYGIPFDPRTCGHGVCAGVECNGNITENKLHE